MADDPVGGGAAVPERLHDRLTRLERRVDAFEVGAARGFERRVDHEVEQIIGPAWRRLTRGEQRWPFSVAVLCIIGLQVALPERLSMSQRWVLPAVEVMLLVVLTAANPGRIERGSAPLRILGLVLIAVVSLANAWSVVRLVVGLVVLGVGPRRSGDPDARDRPVPGDGRTGGRPRGQHPALRPGGRPSNFDHAAV